MSRESRAIMAVAGVLLGVYIILAELLSPQLLGNDSDSSGTMAVGVVGILFGLSHLMALRPAKTHQITATRFPWVPLGFWALFGSAGVYAIARGRSDSYVRIAIGAAAILWSILYSVYLIRRWRSGRS